VPFDLDTLDRTAFPLAPELEGNKMTDNKSKTLYEIKSPQKFTRFQLVIQVEIPSPHYDRPDMNKRALALASAWEHNYDEYCPAGTRLVLVTTDELK
jgi:hypothetical protein